MLGPPHISCRLVIRRLPMSACHELMLACWPVQWKYHDIFIPVLVLCGCRACHGSRSAPTLADRQAFDRAKHKNEGKASAVHRLLFDVNAEQNANFIVLGAGRDADGSRGLTGHHPASTLPQGRSSGSRQAHIVLGPSLATSTNLLHLLDDFVGSPR